MSTNIVEIKAQCANPSYIKGKLKAWNAKFMGVDHQIDTYFKVPIGRLKMRQGNIENQLIQYHRENQAAPKSSLVNLYQSKEPEKLITILTNALGVKVIVDKLRHIYFIDNVKFHVDEVKGLGTFMEIEAINTTGEFTDKQLLTQCQHFMKELNINNEDLIRVSYSDLLLNQK